MSRPSRAVALAGAGLIALTGFALAGLRVDSARRAPAAPYRTATAEKALRPPFLMFQTLAPSRAHGRVAMAAVADTDHRYLTTLRCSRLSYAAGRGVCVTEEEQDGNVKHVAYMFAETFHRGGRYELAGVPTRVRIAPAGGVAAMTTYAEEESPQGERLAIETVLVDARTGQAIADLREFRIEPADAALAGPFDFASVAFDRDGDRFFATLTTPTSRHVVVGSMRDRRLRPIADGLATEALSPDGTRLAVKRRVGDQGFWELGVLDLASMAVRLVDQGGRSVDDQVEWLDAGHLLYHDANDAGTGVWVVAADGQSPPRLFLPEAFSPVVVR